MRFFLAIVLLLGLLYACLPEPQTGLRTISLRTDMFDPSVSRHYYLPYVGWDSVPDSTSVLRFPELGKIKVDFKVADIVIGRKDSVRIGVIHPIEKINGDTFTEFVPDYLMVSSYGVDSIPVSSAQPGVGPISQRTFFRVGRDFYRLASLDDTRSTIEIEPLDRNPNLPIAAEIDIRFKRVPVLDMDGNLTSIGRREGKDLLIYFWGLGPSQGKDLVELDSIYRAIPPERRPDLAAISSTDSQANLEKFLADNDLIIPVYKASAETCDGLNCHPLRPYGFLVNGSGRIVIHNWRPWLVYGYLRSLMEGVDSR